MILIDSHVHIYSCFDVPRLLDSARRNFADAARKLGVGDSFAGVRFLTETSRDDYFRRRSDCATAKPKDPPVRLGGWKTRPTAEASGRAV